MEAKRYSLGPGRNGHLNAHYEFRDGGHMKSACHKAQEQLLALLNCNDSLSVSDMRQMFEENADELEAEDPKHFSPTIELHRAAARDIESHVKELLEKGFISEVAKAPASVP